MDVKHGNGEDRTNFREDISTEDDQEEVADKDGVMERYCGHGRVWIFLVLGMLILLFSSVLIGVYMSVRSVTTSVDQVEVMPSLLPATAGSLSGLLVLLLFWRRCTFLEYAALLMCATTAVLCVVAAVLTGTHVLQPLLSVSECVYSRTDQLCRCLTQFRRDGLQLHKVLYRDRLFLTMAGTLSCEDVHRVLPGLLSTMVAIYAVVSLVCGLAGVIVLLVYRTEQRRIFLQHFAYEDPASPPSFNNLTIQPAATTTTLVNIYANPSTSSHDENNSTTEEAVATPSDPGPACAAMGYTDACRMRRCKSFSQPRRAPTREDSPISSVSSQTTSLISGHRNMGGTTSKLKAHRKKGRRAVTLHGLDRDQLLLILSLQMRYWQESEQSAKRDGYNRSTVNTIDGMNHDDAESSLLFGQLQRRAMTPTPRQERLSSSRTPDDDLDYKPAKLLRSHTPQPHHFKGTNQYAPDLYSLSHHYEQQAAPEVVQHHHEPPTLLSYDLRNIKLGPILSDKVASSSLSCCGHEGSRSSNNSSLASGFSDPKLTSGLSYACPPVLTPGYQSSCPPVLTPGYQSSCPPELTLGYQSSGPPVLTPGCQSSGLPVLTPGCQSSGPPVLIPGYQSSGPPVLTPGCQSSGLPVLTPGCQSSGPPVLIPGYQSSGPPVLTPGCQSSGLPVLTPGYQSSGPPMLTPGCQSSDPMSQDQMSGARIPTSELIYQASASSQSDLESWASDTRELIPSERRLTSEQGAAKKKGRNLLRREKKKECDTETDEPVKKSGLSGTDSNNSKSGTMTDRWSTVMEDRSRQTQTLWENVQRKTVSDPHTVDIPSELEHPWLPSPRPEADALCCHEAPLLATKNSSRSSSKLFQLSGPSQLGQSGPQKHETGTRPVLSDLSPILSVPVKVRQYFHNPNLAHQASEPYTSHQNLFVPIDSSSTDSSEEIDSSPSQQPRSVLNSGQPAASTTETTDLQKLASLGERCMDNVGHPPSHIKTGSDRSDPQSRSHTSDRPDPQPRSHTSDRPDPQSRSHTFDRPDPQSRSHTSDRPDPQSRSHTSDRPDPHPRSQSYIRDSDKPDSQPRSQSYMRDSDRPDSQPRSQSYMRDSDRPDSQPRSQSYMIDSDRPDSQPGSQSYMRDSNRPDSQPRSQSYMTDSDRPDSQPRSQSYMRDSDRPDSQPRSQSYIRDSDRPDSQPRSHTSDRPDPHPRSQSYIRDSDRPDSQPRSQSYMRDSDRPDSQPRSQSYMTDSDRPDSHPRSQSYMRDSDRPDSQPRSQSYIRDSDRPDSQPRSYTSDRPDPHPRSQSYIRDSDRPDSQPRSYTSDRPDSQPRSQSYMTDSDRPDPQPRSQSYMRDSDRPDSQPRSQSYTRDSDRPDSQPRSQSYMTDSDREVMGRQQFDGKVSGPSQAVPWNKSWGHHMTNTQQIEGAVEHATSRHGSDKICFQNRTREPCVRSRRKSSQMSVDKTLSDHKPLLVNQFGQKLANLEHTKTLSDHKPLLVNQFGQKLANLEHTKTLSDHKPLLVNQFGQKLANLEHTKTLSDHKPLLVNQFGQKLANLEHTKTLSDHKPLLVNQFGQKLANLEHNAKALHHQQSAFYTLSQSPQAGPSFHHHTAVQNDICDTDLDSLPSPHWPTTQPLWHRVLPARPMYHSLESVARSPLSRSGSSCEHNSTSSELAAPSPFIFRGGLPDHRDSGHNGNPSQVSIPASRQHNNLSDHTLYTHSHNLRQQQQASCALNREQLYTQPHVISLSSHVKPHRNIRRCQSVEERNSPHLSLSRHRTGLSRQGILPEYRGTANYGMSKSCSVTRGGRGGVDLHAGQAVSRVYQSSVGPSQPCYSSAGHYGSLFTGREFLSKPVPATNLIGGVIKLAESNDDFVETVI